MVDANLSPSQAPGIEEHFGDRLNQLLDLIGIPVRGRGAWLERKFNVSKRTPSLWFQGIIPRHSKLQEIADVLNELANLDDEPNQTELWLVTGKRPGEKKSKKRARSYGSNDSLDHYSKALILKGILEYSKKLNISISTLDRRDVNAIISTMNQLVEKQGDGFIDSPEFNIILQGQLEQAKQFS